MSGRSMLIFVSDIHLTDCLKGASVSREAMFDRFWQRIRTTRGDRPAHLCFVGDIFDIVRSPKWLAGDVRPYSTVDDAVRHTVDQIVDDILQREAGFFSALRQHVEAGALEITYVLGNHDRLLSHCPVARQKIWKALTGQDDPDIEFHSVARFREHGVLAYHGHFGDPICHSADGGAPIGDAIGLELIVQYPQLVRDTLGASDDQTDHAGFHLDELEDIDDVRPIYAVPAWVRQLAVQNKEMLPPMWKSWTQAVDGFFAIDFVQDWMKAHKKWFGLDAGRKLKLLLELSTGRIMAKTHDKRLTGLYRLFQHSFDGTLAKKAVSLLAEEENEGLRYVVNGHSHFPSMVPLGLLEGQRSVYFNTGTWRTVHQIAHHIGGRPSFLPYDAMTYLVFFPDGDRIGRDFEWWTGVMVARDHIVHPGPTLTGSVGG